MKRFSIKIIIFISPILLLLIFIELYLRTLPNAYEMKLSTFLENVSNYNTIVLGSSLAYFGVNPEYFDKPGYNMANVSQDLYYDYQILSKYIDQLKNAKNVIITIGYVSLEHVGVEDWRKYEYLRHYDIQINENLKILNIKEYSLTALYLEAQRLQTVIFNNGYYNFDCLKSSGWYDLGAALGCGNLSKSSGYSRVRVHMKSCDKKRIPENLNYLQLIINLCKENNIKPILILLPVSETYYSNIDIEMYNRLIENCNSICDINKISFYNYFFDNRFLMNDFHDSDHLCTSGAAKISKIINDEVLINEK